MGDDRRRSWRDLDRSRDRGGGTRRDEERGRARAEQTGAYAAYKAQLEKMFTPGGGGLPEHLAAKLGPESSEAAETKRLYQGLSEAPSDDTLRAVLDAGLALPDDTRFLMSLFDAVKEEALLRAVLTRLVGLIEDSGRRPHRMLLLQRLTALESRVDDEESLDLIRDVRGALD